MTMGLVMLIVMLYGRFLPAVPNDNQSKWCGFLLAVEMTIVTKKRRRESVGGYAAHTPFIINVLWSSFRPKGGIHNSHPLLYGGVMGGIHNSLPLLLTFLFSRKPDSIRSICQRLNIKREVAKDLFSNERFSSPILSLTLPSPTDFGRFP